MSSLSKASELNFKTYLNDLEVDNLIVENGTVNLNGFEVATNGDTTTNGEIIGTGAIGAGTFLQAPFTQPQLNYDLINQPTFYRAFSSVTMAAQVDVVASGATPNNIDLVPKDNSGMDINLYDFGTNFKLDLDINADPSNVNNYMEIQLIDENDVAIVADYHTTIFVNSVAPATYIIGPVASWQIQTNTVNVLHTSINLSFNLNSVGSSGNCSMNGNYSTWAPAAVILNRYDITCGIKNIGAGLKIKKIRLRINNANHTGYTIRSRLYSCA